MQCLNNLIASQFLKNTTKELQLARNTLSSSVLPEPGQLPCTKKEQKKLYNTYMDILGFRDLYSDMDVDDYDMLYYLQDGYIVWLATRNKHSLKDAISDSLYTNGDIPFYQAKQFINSKLYYVAMYDLTFRMQPLTKN